MSLPYFGLKQSYVEVLGMRAVTALIVPIEALTSNVMFVWWAARYPLAVIDMFDAMGIYPMFHSLQC